MIFFNGFALMFTSTISFSSAWCSQCIRSHFLLAVRFSTENIPLFFFNKIAEICLYYEMLKTREHCFSLCLFSSSTV